MEKYLWFVVFNILLVKAFATLTLSTSSTYAVENQDYILICHSSVVTTAIVWTRNDTDVVVMYMQSNVCGSADVGSGLSSNYRYNCTDNKTYNLIIPANRIQQEDGSKWQCKDAAGGGESVILSLSVARPPTSDPVVTGYGGTILYPGNTLKLTCTVQDGTPLATLSWTCKGSSVTGVDKSNSKTAISKVTVNIDSSYNGQMCVCKAEHLSWTTDKTTGSQQFVVHYPPSSDPVVSGYDGYKLYVNNSIALSCQITGGNPLATLSWTCDGQDYPGTNRHLVNTAISELSITATSNLNGKSCICKGRHPVTSYSKNINSATFVVYYAPSESPVLTGYVSGQPIYKGNKQLECKVTGGYPLSLLTMTCNNIVQSGTDLSTSTESRFIYHINVDKTYNKQQCICNGRHPDQNIGYNRKATVIFNVYFAPDTAPVISGYKDNHIIYEPENKDLTCRATGGNPVATLIWTCRGLAVSGTNHSVEGEARSTITLYINRDYNNKQCVCTATHPADNYNRQTNVTFTVYYVDLLTMASNRTFDNTQDIQLICSFKGNDIGMIFHPWTHKIGSITVRTLNGSNTINQTVLVIPYSSYQDVGTYTCYVYNSYGKLMKSKDIEVTVYDKPVITETIKIQENDNHGELIVDFYSVPKPLKVEWSTKGSIISLSEKYRQSNTIVPISLTLHNVKVTLEGYRAQLSITSITEADYRTYILRIENSKGKAEQHVDFQRKAEKKDVTDIGLGVGVTVGVVVVVAFVTIVIVIRCRRTKQKDGVETVVKNESKYEDLQARRETNVYNGPEIQVHNYTNASETSENLQFESLQNTDDNKSTYEEIRMTGDITPTS